MALLYAILKIVATAILSNISNSKIMFVVGNPCCVVPTEFHNIGVCSVAGGNNHIFHPMALQPKLRLGLLL
jgi:hypothetical protein